MKNCLLIAILLVILTACSEKPDTGIDPRDQYTGEYNMIFKATGTSDDGVPVNVNQAGTVSVVEGLEANQIAFVFDQKYLTATLSETTFTLVPIISPVDKDFVTTGSGSFGKNSFTMKTIGKGGNNYPTELIMTGTRK